jgi:hypothetical protein
VLVLNGRRWQAANAADVRLVAVLGARATNRTTRPWNLQPDGEQPSLAGKMSHTSFSTQGRLSNEGRAVLSPSPRNRRLARIWREASLRARQQKLRTVL